MSETCLGIALFTRCSAALGYRLKHLINYFHDPKMLTVGAF